jgi:hypothetical protein
MKAQSWLSQQPHEYAVRPYGPFRGPYQTMQKPELAMREVAGAHHRTFH